MKLSSNTTMVLKNFATINQNLVIKEGSELLTMSSMKNIVAKATVEESFPVEFAIYDLNEFLGTVSLFDLDCDFEFGDDAVIIKDSSAQQKYFYADKSIVATPPEKGITLPSVEVEKTITKENLTRLAKAASINNASDITFTEEGIVVHDKTVPTSNKFTINQKEDSSAKYNLSISVDKLKFIIDDYKVSICAKGLSLFSGASGIDYYVALQPDGEYGN